VGKLAGRASLAHHLRELGIDLGPSAGATITPGNAREITPGNAREISEQSDLLEQLREHVVELGDRKQRVRPADLQRWLAPRMLR